MPESAQHARLVKAIVTRAEKYLGEIGDIRVCEDAVQPIRSERPPKICGFIPDVFATDVPTSVTLIGEAKTASDLETNHSRKQIAAFLKFLAHTPGGIFLLAVPIELIPRGRATIRELSQSLGKHAPQTEVIDDSGIVAD